MSIQFQMRIYNILLGNSNRKSLAVKLADHADDDGRGIWPAVSKLARHCEISPRTVQRILKDFVDEGLLIVRKKGGHGRYSTTRYDFNLEAVKRLEQSQKPAENDTDEGGNSADFGADQERETAPESGETGQSLGCHGVTLSHDEAVAKGDKSDVKGDKSNSLGCHGDTQTIIEPPNNHHSQRASAPSRNNPADGGEREMAAKGGGVNPIDMPSQWQGSEKDFIAAWNAYGLEAGQSPQNAKRKWFDLTVAERWTAQKRIQSFQAAWKAQGRTHKHAFSTYLGDRLWETVEDPAPEPDAPPPDISLPKFGKAWGLMRLRTLLTVKPLAVSDTMPEPARAHRQWPYLAELDGSRTRSIAPGSIGQHHLDACVQVRVGSAEWQAWADFHESRQLLMVHPGETTEFVWFPASTPDAWPWLAQHLAQNEERK